MRLLPIVRKISGSWSTIVCETFAYAKVDDQYFDYLNQFRWFFDSNRYVVRKEGSGKNGRLIYLHIEVRVLAGQGIASEGDHRDRDKLNNQISNLRPATRSQNMQNTIKSSSTGFKGVWYNKSRKKYQAAITSNKERFHLGLFDDPVEAARSYDEAATRLNGEFALTNKALGLL